MAGLEVRPWPADDAAPLAAGRPRDEAKDPILAPHALRSPHGKSVPARCGCAPSGDSMDDVAAAADLLGGAYGDCIRVVAES